MSNHEQAQASGTGKKYTESDMLAAFRHGRNYETSTHEGDIATASLPEKNRPFFGWLKLRDNQ